jgi:predicted kinase
MVRSAAGRFTGHTAYGHASRPAFSAPARTLAGVLIVLSGLPGTGKSGIAGRLGRALRIPVLSVDPIESAMLRAGLARSFETGLAAYGVAGELADRNLADGLDTVIDAVNAVEEARDMWRRLAEARSTKLVIIECVVSDRAVHAARLALRNRGLALPEPTWASVEERSAEWSSWPEPHLTLDAMEAHEHNVAMALAYVRKLGSQRPHGLLKAP